MAGGNKALPRFVFGCSILSANRDKIGLHGTFFGVRHNYCPVTIHST